MLQNILGALLSGASQGGAQPQASNQPQAGGDLLSGLLGSLMGGQTSGTGMTTGSQTNNQPQAGGDMLSGLLGSFLGGQTSGAPMSAGNQAGSNPLMNLVSSGQNPMVNSLIQPIVDSIAQKLGISPAIAMTVVTFAVHYMLSNHGTKLVKGEDISGVLQQHTNKKYIQSAGLSQQLASQTGMKPKVAANALSETCKLLGVPSPTN